MAITINWTTKVISVPKADLTLIQSTPTEIRELNLNDFRLTLKDLEDSEEGMPYLDTHSHNAPVDVGGVSLARVVEIINGYTVTFEDDQYAVNLVGANSNVGDVVNVNQVSVRSANSAGLVSNAAIEYSSYGGGVLVNASSSYNGTTFPIGTVQQPVNNIPDAVLIAQVRGFKKIFIQDSITLDTGDNVDDYILVGDSPNHTTITCNPGASTVNTQFMDCTLKGTLDGGSTVRNSIIETLNFVDGIIRECMLNPYTITLSGANTAHFIDCQSGVPGFDTPVIDMNGTGTDLSIRNYSGGIKLINKTGSDNVSIDLDPGTAIIDSTCTDTTADSILIRGTGLVTNNAPTAGIVNTVGLISRANVATSVWDATASDYNTSGTMAKEVKDTKQYAGAGLGM